MVYVKKFDKGLGYYGEEKFNIDNQINSWLEKNNYTLIDVKYSVTNDGYESALVIYNDNEDKNK